MPELEDAVPRAGGHEPQLGALADAPVEDAQKNDDAAVVVVLAVEDQRLERRVRVTGRGGDVRHDVLQHGVNVDPGLRGDLRRVLRGNADDLLDLVLDPLRLRGRQVDFVDNG